MFFLLHLSTFRIPLPLPAPSSVVLSPSTSISPFVTIHCSLPGRASLPPSANPFILYTVPIPIHPNNYPQTSKDFVPPKTVFYSFIPSVMRYNSFGKEYSLQELFCSFLENECCEIKKHEREEAFNRSLNKNKTSKASFHNSRMILSSRGLSNAAQLEKVSVCCITTSCLLVIYPA